ncbi:MAG: hypothetical protein AB1567_00840 [bacterium]
MIQNCNCNHSFQDKRYGKGMRVFNIAGKDKKKLRCTVCKREIEYKEKEGKNK